MTAVAAIPRAAVVLIKPRLCPGGEEWPGGPRGEKQAARNGTGGTIQPCVRKGWNCREIGGEEATVKSIFAVAYWQQCGGNARRVDVSGRRPDSGGKPRRSLLLGLRSFAAE